MRLVISLTLLLSLTGCSTWNWQATLGNWLGSACDESDDCTRSRPKGERPIGPSDSR
ncbi:hypothetical protein [Algihabitans albus]|uniref:hypothetical protein n=1 Tax=Algihabitans albus TaxID=2164067 RepID=UPI0013C31FA7|nr:hypothetical protein [Algihabitans albus]